jgi:hypothetical protein
MACGWSGGREPTAATTEETPVAADANVVFVLVAFARLWEPVSRRA